MSNFLISASTQRTSLASLHVAYIKLKQSIFLPTKYTILDTYK